MSAAFLDTLWMHSLVFVSTMHSMVGEIPAYQAAAAIQEHFGFSEIFWMHQRTLRSQTSGSSPFRLRPYQKIMRKILPYE
jgi:hypothetical protein